MKKAGCLLIFDQASLVQSASADRVSRPDWVARQLARSSKPCYHTFSLARFRLFPSYVVGVVEMQ